MMYRDRTHVPAPPVGFCDQNTYPAASIATHWETSQQEMTTSGAAASIVAAVHLIS